MTSKSGADMPVWIGPLLVLAGGICIGFAPIGLRLGLGDLEAQSIAFWRFMFAIPALYILVLIVKRRSPSRPNRFVAMAGVLFACNVGFWHWALTLTTVANATFIVGLGNVGAGLTAWIFLAHRPSRIWALAVLIALTGAAALSLGGGESGKSDIGGDLLAVTAALFVSGYVVASTVARRSISGLDLIFWVTIVEACVAAMFVTAFQQAFLPDSLSGFAAPLFLALFVQVMGQGFILTGLGHTSPAIAGILLLSQPVVAAAVSWQLFDEPLTGLQGGGAVLILVGILISQRGKPQSTPKAT